MRPNNIELEKSGSNTFIHGLKLIINCKKCGRKWSIWFSGEEDLNYNLPNNWHICSTCQDKENAGER